MNDAQSVSFINFALMRKIGLTTLLLSISLLMFSNINLIDSLKTELPNLDGEKKIKTLIILSESSRNINFSECIQYADSAFDFAKLLKETELMAYVKKSLGVSFYYDGNLENSINNFKESFDIYTKNNNKQGQADCLNNIGLIYEEWGKLDTASKYYQNSYDIEVELGNTKGMAVSLVQIGNISYYTKTYEKSMDYYYRALLLFEEIDYDHGIALTQNAIGIIYKLWNQYDKAIESFEKARNIYIKGGEKRTLSFVLNNLADIYNVEYKDYKKAHKLYEESLKLKRCVEDAVGIALVKNNIGTLYANMENYPLALDYFNESIKLYKESGVISALAMVYYNIGCSYFELHNTPKAIDYYQKSLKISIDTKRSEYISSSYEGLLLCYAKNGNFNNFEKYFDLYNISKDTIIDKYYELQSIKVDNKYQSKLQQLRNTKLTEDNEKMGQEVRSYKLILCGIAGLLIIALFIYVLLIRYKSNS